MNGAARDGRGQSGTARDGAARMRRLGPADGEVKVKVVCGGGGVGGNQVREYRSYSGGCLLLAVWARTS